MNRGRLFKYISNISFGLGAVLAIIALYLVISARAAGSCPVNHLPFIIPALILLITAFVTSFFAEKKDKKNRNRVKPSGDDQ